MTYLDLATKIGVSEVTVKRWLTRQDVKLERLAEIGRTLGFELTDLVQSDFLEIELAEEYSLEQELFFVGNSRPALLFLKLLVGFELRAVQRLIGMSETELIRSLRALEKIKVLEMLPGDKVRVQLKGPFRWRGDGPMMRHYFPILRDTLYRHFASQFEQMQDRPKASGYGVFRPFEMYLQHTTATQLSRELMVLLEKYRQISAFEYRSKKHVEPVAGLVAVDGFDAWAEIHLGRESAALKGQQKVQSIRHASLSTRSKVTARSTN